MVLSLLVAETFQSESWKVTRSLASCSRRVPFSCRGLRFPQLSCLLSPSLTLWPLPLSPRILQTAGPLLERNSRGGLRGPNELCLGAAALEHGFCGSLCLSENRKAQLCRGIGPVP